MSEPITNHNVMQGNRSPDAPTRLLEVVYVLADGTQVSNLLDAPTGYLGGTDNASGVLVGFFFPVHPDNTPIYSPETMADILEEKACALRKGAFLSSPVGGRTDGV